MDWLRSRAALLVPVAVLLGLSLRSYHFLRCPAVWHDEAALMLNALGLSFGDMLGPLLHAEAAPPLFLMAEHAVVLVLGDGVFALRLLPFLASCLSLVLFALLARRLLGPLAAALAVSLFAVSDRLLWHACEAKPYAVDVLVAVVAAWWFARTEGWSLWRRCVPAAIIAPLAVWVSFPACFILGGLIAGFFPAAIRSRWSGRAAFAGLVLSVAAAFLALALGPIAAQRCDAMDSCWTSQFPDWSRPWFVPTWATLQTLEAARYCLLPFGQVLAVFAVIGAVMWWRSVDRSLRERNPHAEREDYIPAVGRDLVAVLLVPLGLALAASCLHKYPYGGTRVEAFATPTLCLLTAAGAGHAFLHIARKARLLALLCALAFLPPFLLTAYRVIEPWPRAASDEATAFVIEHRQADEPIFGNFWEHEYYLRHEPTYRAWQGSFEPRELLAGRAWVIHTGEVATEEYPFPLPPGWEVAGRTAFERTSVFELKWSEVTPARATP